MESVREVLREILQELHPEIDAEKEKHLMEGGILDSFDLITLLTMIRERLHVTISADKIGPEHFDSIDALCALIGTLEKET